MIRKIKKVAVASGIALSLCLCHAFVGVSPVFAQNLPLEYETVSITNSSFASNPTSPYLDTAPVGWTANSNTTKKGIIHVGTTQFSGQATSSYNLQTTENPSKTGEDDRILMLNARKNNVSHTNNMAIDGFTSDAITLDSYSNYRLSVSVHTANNAKASIVLLGLDEEGEITDVSEHYFSGIQTNQASNDWQEYSFYIQTASKSQSIKLNLAIGDITPTNQFASYGQVFFDEVSLVKCSENFFVENLIQNYTQSNYIAYENYDMTPSNFNFEDGLENWEKIGTYGENQTYEAGIKQTKNIDLGSTNSYDNTKALYFSADKANPVHVGYRSAEFDILAANTYRISVLAKTKDLVGTLSLNFVETDFVEKNYKHELTPTKKTITVTTTDGPEIINEYQEFVFYVKGYELYDTQAQIEVVFGEDNVPASGKAVVDDIKVMMYDHDDFAKLSSSSTTYQKITLSSITGAPSFTNGAFNNAHFDTIEHKYPMTPSDWTQTSKTAETCIFGVVNTAKWAEIDSSKKPITASPQNPAFETENGLIVPVSSTTSNNILMLYNKTASTQVVTSPTFTANANSYYTLSFNFKTLGDALTVKILDSDNNAVFADDNIPTTTAWSTYKITLKTEYTSVETLKVVLELNSEDINAGAYAFFDNFQFFTNANMDNDAFQAAIDNGAHTVDLSNLGIHQTGDYDSISGMYEAIMFSGKLEAGSQVEGTNPIAFGGIINDENIYGIEFPDTHSNVVRNMLMIQNHAIADYNLTSKNSIALTSGKYYKFSVYVKTSFLQNSVDEETFGAYFKLVGIEDAALTKIVSGNLFNQYIIYLNATEDANVQIQFGLNTIDNNSQMALFDTFNFEEITKSDFSSAVESNNILILNNITVEAEDETTPPENANLGASIWIQISTIVMVLAIVIAVVGGLLRKKKINKFKAKKHAEYVERVSSVRDAHVVEAEKRRNNEVAQLLKEKEHLAIYLKDLEDENKKRLAEQRKVLGKTITRKAEKEFKAYASNRQKIVRDMSRIDERIKEAQSPEYLARILKLVQNEKIKEMENNDKID